MKDEGLRALLRRFAAAPPSSGHGLIVVTSRAEIVNVRKWRSTAAPTLDLEALSDEAGARLLSDNGAKGSERDLRAAARDFGGHPLALTLLAHYLRETQNGDINRRDHIRGLLVDADNPRHDHARRVMESFETEWLAGEPLLLRIMYIVGLFDRPASGELVRVLRSEPVIAGLTEPFVGLDDDAWRRAAQRLRDVRLLSRADAADPDGFDAHPLTRDWFGKRLLEANETAWKEAHGRLYEHLRDTTQEGDPPPNLEALAPLYQAVSHGCRAGRYQETLDDVYRKRICRRGPDGQLVFYARKMLGATGADLAAISWFFAAPYAKPVAVLTPADQSWVLSEAGYALRALGRLGEAAPAMRAALAADEAAGDLRNAAVSASNLADLALERARLALWRRAGFAPLADAPLAPETDEAAQASLATAPAELATAATLIAACGYRKCDAELGELQAVVRGERAPADLPPRV